MIFTLNSFEFEFGLILVICALAVSPLHFTDIKMRLMLWILLHFETMLDACVCFFLSDGGESTLRGKDD